MKKICTMCGDEKELSEFHQNLNCRHGKNSRCKECCKIIRRQTYLKRYKKERSKQKEYYKKNKEKCTENTRAYRKTLMGQLSRKREYYNLKKDSEKYKKILERSRAYSKSPRGKEVAAATRKRNRNKIKVRAITNRAINCGDLIRGNCAYPNCTSQKVDAHHWDYTKPLEVVWFCKKHHAIADKIQKFLS